MMRGRMLSELISDLRDELRRANNAAASPDDIPSLRRTINRVMQSVWLSHDWPHLRTDFPAINLVAGQRFYDYPAGLDPDRVEIVRVFWSGTYTPVERGITRDDYNAHDPEQNDRSSPVLKWDIRFTGVKEQIEVWPLPDGAAQKLHLRGTYACPTLVNDSDVCPLDSGVVLLFAAIELLPKDSPDREIKSSQVAERLRLLKARANGGAERVWTNGGAAAQEPVHPRATVTVR